MVKLVRQFNPITIELENSQEYDDLCYVLRQVLLQGAPMFGKSVVLGLRRERILHLLQLLEKA